VILRASEDPTRRMYTIRRSVTDLFLTADASRTLIGEAGFRFLEFMSRSCRRARGTAEREAGLFASTSRPLSNGEKLADGDSPLRLIGLSRWSTLRDTIAHSLLIIFAVARNVEMMIDEIISVCARSSNLYLDF